MLQWPHYNKKRSEQTPSAEEAQALLTSFFDSVAASAIFCGVVSSSSSISAAGDLINLWRRTALDGQAVIETGAGVPHTSLSQHWAAPSATDWCIPSVWRRGIEGPSFLLLSDCITSTAPERPHSALCNTKLISGLVWSFFSPHFLFVFFNKKLTATLFRMTC